MLAQWMMGYWSRNYTDVVQGVVFALVTVWLVFRDAPPKTKGQKLILSFLVSYNTAQMLSGLLYFAITSRWSLTGTFLDFLMATGCLLLPVFFLMGFYRKVVGVHGPAAVFIYTLFFNANCLAMLIAMTALQRMLITVVLSLALVYCFRKEVRYILFEKSVLRTDRRFHGTTVAFMVLIGAEAELPRIVINGGVDTVGNQLAYAVAIAGALLIVLFAIFMKFNFFAIMNYENFIREHDDDAVTGAKSLSYLLEEGWKMCQRAKARGQELAVFYSNIAHFRDVNIVHGYDTGTAILRQTATLLTAAFPDGIVARISGTHFTGIVPLAQAEEQFNQVARQVEALSLDETLVLQVGICPVASLNASTEDKTHYSQLTTLIDLAAIALRYLDEGQGTVKFYDDAMRQNEAIRLHVLAHVDDAVRDGWLCVYYQPLVDVQCGTVASYEALSRWIDPQFGFLTPDQFVEPLESVHMIYKVDLNVLRRYGRQLKEWQAAGRPALPISFNISRTDLEAGIDLFGEIEALIQEWQIPKRLIHVEITETALNGDSAVMQAAVRRFHAMGLEVWMDDFGSGYSSLNVLKDYQFDVIKIDMVFMRKFDERAKTIVRAVCQMAADLGIRTVAEGVETPEHYAFLKEIGCTYAQGYLFSKPVPPDQIPEQGFEF
jgi:EAL domain-containing protein (putative c-di-GMP-specific phosphodiesterase class I)/GGDEF domain-containing protein